MLIKARLSKTERQKKQIKLTFVIPMDESDHDFETIDGMPGYLLFQAKPITKEIEEGIENKFLGVETGGRSWSQKLRGTLLNIWGKLHQDKTTSDEFYEKSMREIVDHFEKTYLKND